MVLIGKRPVLDMIVLGAVATGNINAQLALIAAGTIRDSGGTPAAIAAAARIGIISVVVAVLLVISVKNVIQRQMTAIMASIGQPAIPARHERCQVQRSCLKQ